MLKKILGIGAVVLVLVLVVGTMVAWAYPGREGTHRRAAEADPVRATPIESVA